MSKTPVLWNRLESAYSIENSVVGPNGTIVELGAGSITFPSAYFGNGTFVDKPSPADEASMTFNMSSFTSLGSRGTIEFWMKTPHSRTTNQELLEIRFSNGHSYFSRVYAVGIVFWADNGVGTQSAVASGYNHPTNTWIHVAFVWDADTISGTSDTSRIYINGTNHDDGTWTNTGTPSADGISPTYFI